MSGNKPVILGRSLLAATTAAIRRGHTRCTIELLNQKSYAFEIVEVIEDALIGHRPVAAERPMLIPFHAIATIEFLA